jgi:hypothetical protein
VITRGPGTRPSSRTDLNGSGCPRGYLRPDGQVFQFRRGLAAIGFRFLSLAVRPATLPIGSAELAMLIKEPRGMLMHLGRLVVNGSRMLMRRDTPALMLLALAIRFAHNSRFSLG